MAGSSSFPTSVDNYTEKTDGVDVIVADDVNDSYAAVNAIETFIGASGKSQANNVSLYTFLAERLPTIKLSYVDADTVQASAGIVYCKNYCGNALSVS